LEWQDCLGIPALSICIKALFDVQLQAGPAALVIAAEPGHGGLSRRWWRQHLHQPAHDFKPFRLAELERDYQPGKSSSTTDKHR
jgi:hypothetical protein